MEFQIYKCSIIDQFVFFVPGSWGAKRSKPEPAPSPDIAEATVDESKRARHESSWFLFVVTRSNPLWQANIFHGVNVICNLRFDFLKLRVTTSANINQCDKSVPSIYLMQAVRNTKSKLILIRPRRVNLSNRRVPKLSMQMQYPARNNHYFHIACSTNKFIQSIDSIHYQYH